MDSNKDVPNWLFNNEENDLYPCVKNGVNKKNDFIEKTINDATSIIKDILFFEDTALKDGLLQKLDPRVKVISLFILVTTATLIHNAEILIFLYLISCTLAKLSNISLKHFIKRVWLVIPFFTGIMVLPSIFNFVRPGTTLMTLMNLGHKITFGPLIFPSVITITKEGTAGALLITLRVGTAVSFAFLFTVTTRWNELLRAFRILFLPQIFVTIMAMCYRYIFILLNITTDMFTSRKSRTIDKIDSIAGRGFAARTMGALFGKSYSLQGEVYEAMVSRGYKGEQLTIDKFKYKMLDFQWIVCLLIFVLAAFGGEIIIG